MPSTTFADLAYQEYPYDHKIKVSFKPYTHQQEAWKALSNQAYPRRGLLVMPTGAGKTKTIVHWLHKYVLSEPDPRPILWLTHRAELIQQAAKTFGELRGVAKRESALTVRCISGAHGNSATSLLQPADVILCTIQSLISKNHEGRITEFYRRNPKAVIIVDEAHHAAAGTYQDILGQAKRYKSIEIIGLTATPTRTVEAEISKLKKIFKDQILYQIDQATLIEKGILARPACSTVKTKFNFDRDLTAKEKIFIDNFKDIPPSILRTIGKSTARNKLIVNHYLNNKSRFGKTLVFATDIIHCQTLNKEFTKRGISADYVASVKDNDVPNQKVVERFRQGKFDVLTSVSMLTEGVDLPKVETVFLARPTGSEILMRQMVGRGMRGPKAGGPKDVHIVSFADHWERFPDWLDPMAFLSDAIVPPEAKQRKRLNKPKITLPWELLSAISEMAPDIEPTNVFTSLPIGWYDLKYSTPDTGKASAVLVYEHQKEALEEFIGDALAGNYVLSGRGGPVERYFSDVPDPRPSKQALVQLARYLDEFAKPKFISFKQKDEFDPEVVVKNCLSMSAKALVVYAEKVFDETIACEIYPSKESYTRAVLDALADTIYEKERAVDDVVIQKRIGKTLPGPARISLPKLMIKVSSDMALEKKPPSIMWSKRDSNSVWGLYRYSDQKIIINRALNTTAISKKALEFLIYHELLHHELGAEHGHDTYFREREREFTGYMDAEAELDTLPEKYYIPGMRLKK